MSEFTPKKATRVGVIPLIDLYSESGAGKSYSALLLARGLAGPNGKIVMIDSESRRGSLYADVIPGGYEVIDIESPFTPSRYILAMQAAFDSNPACVVVDSMSHEWEGIGGVNDMATENETRSGKPGLHNWKQPKMEHQKLVQFLLRAPVPVVCCIRAKYKTRQKKDDRGRTVIVKDDTTSPIQEECFIFEATAHAEILPDHSINLTKCSHPSLRECFPSKGPITIQHGEMIAKWCAAAGAPQPTAKTKSPLDEAKAKLWNILKSVPTIKDIPAAQSWLESNKILIGKKLSDCTVEELTVAAEKADLVINPPQ